MNAPAELISSIPINSLPQPGDPIEGGFYAGRIRVGDQVCALICAPKSVEIAKTRWHKNQKPVTGAASFFDGLSNTKAMADAGSPLARKILALDTNGFADWYLPSRDELELLYRAFKPTSDSNWCWRGDNPSSVPVGYAYAPESPAQTALEEFRKGGAEAFEEALYWSCTQYAGYEGSAWAQDFGDGTQGSFHKVIDLRARPVRRLPL